MFSLRDERYPDRRVSVTRNVDAPAQALFDLLADPAKHVLLDGSGTVRASSDRSPRRLALGSRFAMRMHLVVPYRVVNSVVDFEEGRRIAWRHFGGHRWIWELEPLDGAARTRVTEIFDWSSARAPGLIELLGYPARNEHAMLASLERLEKLVELEDSRGTGRRAETAGC